VRQDFPALADWILKRALELGADEAEVSFSVSTSRSVKSEGIHPKALFRSSSDVWVRVAKGRRVAITTATSLERDVLLETVEKAVKLASFSEEDPHWGGLPDPEGPLHGWVGFDEGIVTLETNWLLQQVRLMIDEASRRYKDVKVTGAGGVLTHGYSYIANTRGLSAEQRGTLMSISLSTKAARAGSEGTGFAFLESRSLILDFDELVDKACRMALDSAMGEKLGSSVSGTVAFRPLPLALLLDYLLVPAFNAMNVLEGLSPLRGKLGERVFGKLTLVDDGSMPGGLETSLFDAEGVPRRRTVLVEEGVVRGFLHNTYTARRMGAKSTGNASKTRGAYAVSRSNIIAGSGDLSEEDVQSLAQVVIDGGLLSVHTVNYVTGNFSVVATNPYLVRSGELKPLKPVSVAGNIYQSAETLEFARKIVNTYAGFYLPTTIIGKITVSG